MQPGVGISITCDCSRWCPRKVHCGCYPSHRKVTPKCTKSPTIKDTIEFPENEQEPKVKNTGKCSIL